MCGPSLERTIGVDPVQQAGVGKFGRDEAEAVSWRMQQREVAERHGGLDAGQGGAQRVL